MRIGIMLRTIKEKQGIGIYTRNLMDELLPMDRGTDYVLFYRELESMGRYAGHPNVTEQLVRAPNKALWDQVAIPRAARRARVDLLFNTKFTVPLLARMKTVMSLHGASWFVHPELYNCIGIAYIKVFMPLYCRKATQIVSNSELTTQDFIRIVKVPADKIHTVRLGMGGEFRVIDDDARKAAVRTRYDLPERFILSVIKYDPRKNFENLIAAFRLLRKRVSCKLVCVGIGCDKYIEEYGLDQDGTVDDMRFLGWIDHDELPVLYNLAHCLFFPSVYEEFGIPTCEALACGCPVVVSKTGNLPDLAGDAGLLVDPFNPAAMADALERIWTDPELHRDLAVRSLKQSELFSWERCARETLKVLHGALQYTVA